MRRVVYTLLAGVGAWEAFVACTRPGSGAGFAFTIVASATNLLNLAWLFRKEDPPLAVCLVWCLWVWSVVMFFLPTNYRDVVVAQFAITVGTWVVMCGGFAYGTAKVCCDLKAELIEPLV